LEGISFFRGLPPMETKRWCGRPRIPHQSFPPGKKNDLKKLWSCFFPGEGPKIRIIGGKEKARGTKHQEGEGKFKTAHSNQKRWEGKKIRTKKPPCYEVRRTIRGGDSPRGKSSGVSYKLSSYASKSGEDRQYKGRKGGGISGRKRKIYFPDQKRGFSS